MGGSATIINCYGVLDPATGGTLQSGGSNAFFPRDNCWGTQGTLGFGGNACTVLGGGGGAGYYGGGGGASGGYYKILYFLCCFFIIYNLQVEEVGHRLLIPYWLEMYHILLLVHVEMDIFKLLTEH